LVAAERLGVDPAVCLALEDSLFGVMAASSAGMMTCMVPDLIGPKEERGWCAHIASDLHEIRAMLMGDPSHVFRRLSP
jgi:beta-phosphoglucomutase-like phosphatase (HAD superfamily)